MKYTHEQQRYIDSVDGEAHMSAVEIIGRLEKCLADTIEQNCLARHALARYREREATNGWAEL